MAAQKAVLTIGLTVNASGSSALVEKYGGRETLMRTISEQVEKVKATGFECASFQIDPEESEKALETLKTMLRERKWEGVLFGWGMRATPEHTVLFENTVNLTREVSPDTRLLFSNAPSELFSTVRRNFGDGN